MRTCILAVALVIGAHGPAFAQRLPMSATPTHYTLWFAPDLQNATFRGRETIDVTVPGPLTSITINAAEIEFGTATITAGGRQQTARVTVDERQETATLTVADPIARGNASIQITYTGTLNDKLRGFYLSKANGRNYAVTQMEPTDARRAFPGWDEPSYKATFDISLMIDSGDVAISNGAPLSDTPGPEPGKHTIVFGRTARISTYLVAMLVGDFECRSGSSDGIPVRVCSTPQKLPLTAFALDAAQQAVKFFDDWTGIKYPFGKLDIIGIPDFSAGAMENAGAITFRESMLFADPQGAAVGTRKTVASVLAHEIAHQWFGDLVTMRWWDDVWLNEGFATWMANKPLAQWHPEWQVELDEVENTQAAVATDALRTTRPIRTSVETTAEINQVFDDIAYQKTASVLRMLEFAVGPELFRKGVQSYLTKYAFGNATGDDFWNQVARATGKPVDRLMRPFIEQPGVPLITIDEKCRGNATEVSLHQERFTTISDRAAAGSALWSVPVCFKVDGSSAPQCQILDRRDQTLSLTGCSVTAFGNADGRGYYVSQYAADTVRAIARTAARTLAATERLSLLDDEWWMTRSGRHDIGVYLDAASALAADRTPNVVDQISGSFAYTRSTIADAADVPRFEDRVRRLFGPELTAVGLPGTTSDPDDVQSRRATLLALVGIVGNARDVQQQARQLALSYVDDPKGLPATLASTVLRVAAVNGDASLYDRYMAQLPKYTNNPELYYRFATALAAFREPSLVNRTLEYALSPAVRSQDTPLVLGSMMGQRSPRTSTDATDIQVVTWNFVKGHWDELTKKLGMFQGIPAIVFSTGAFCSRDLQSDVQQFFQQHPVPAAQRALQQSMERIQNCVAVKERQSAPLSAWLAAPSR